MLYAGEGVSRKPDENSQPPALLDDHASVVSGGSSGSGGGSGNKSGSNIFAIKGHEFVQISFHMPASCDCCTKPLWAPFRPPPALECKRE